MLRRCPNPIQTVCLLKRAYSHDMAILALSLEDAKPAVFAEMQVIEYGWFFRGCLPSVCNRRESAFQADCSSIFPLTTSQHQKRSTPAARICRQFPGIWIDALCRI